METKKYEVKWKEYHSAEVEAENETQAFEAAAEYAGGRDTRVDEDEYECRLVDEPDEVELSASVISGGMNIRRVVTVEINGTAVVIEDCLHHPVELMSRSLTTRMDTDMLYELIRQLGYVKRDEV